ncbi:nuclear transport factor 2 family protein [Jongsikchunia kroppenstedtii]|uniref:nuclear transport factor 2 family protein n=1 Tax=Jongsikchunia kroppenstedtii TaxID=1121721 RepID=UPI0003703953|nr:nuclear transport factor 2 family protein [Jongsikchunia kroppenstedtii]
MAIIDPSKTWKLLEERLATTTNPRHKQILEIVLEHAQAEAKPDLDGLMATLAPNPDYHFWNDGHDVGPKTTEGVRAYYTAFVESKSNILEFDLDRLLVDDEGLMMEGYLRQIYPGAYAAQLGFPIDDPDAAYFIEFRQLIVWPVDADGKIIGEDSYHSGPSRIEKLTQEQLPQEYIDMMAGAS